MGKPISNEDKELLKYIIRRYEQSVTLVASDILQDINKAKKFSDKLSFLVKAIMAIMATTIIEERKGVENFDDKTEERFNN